MEQQVMIEWQEKGLAATVHYPESLSNTSRFPLIIICHGFTGSRQGVHRLFVNAARRLAEKEYAVLRFDYSGCGESEGEYGRTYFDEFIQQTRQAIAFGRQLEYIDSANVILLGHSLGGAIALYTAVLDGNISRLILWSAVGNPFEDIVSIVGEKAYRSFQAEGKASLDYLGYSFTKDFFDSMIPYQPLLKASAYKGDVFIIHGTADDEIPSAYSEEYDKKFCSRQKGMCESYFIQGAGHTYSSCGEKEELVRHTLSWLFKTEKQNENAEIPN
ncbi:alpha/beta hydrolase [Heyndrickxia acidicola]|uniref:Alpha/beta hydrolase n=1 Tax=Heyndrickxia acidicola TaxID=209389 RepID=A0ABU6MJP7_9BACI|nr:alpha/beta hydrolase [Heyndrickxia acidicola]MED1204592.1 alpha/beta hydrolase [Heyndrickxia acidicola]